MFIFQQENPVFDVQDWLVPTKRRDQSSWLDQLVQRSLVEDVSITGQLRNPFLGQQVLSITLEHQKSLLRKIFSDESFVDLTAYLSSEVQSFLVLLKYHPDITLTGRVAILSDEGIPVFRVAYIGEKDFPQSRRPHLPK